MTVTVEEVQALLDANLGPFVRVVSANQDGDLTGKRDPVYDGDGEGRPAIRIWPSVFKDVNYDVLSAEATPEGSVKVTTHRGVIVLRTAPDQHKVQ